MYHSGDEMQDDREAGKDEVQTGKADKKCRPRQSGIEGKRQEGDTEEYLQQRYGQLDHANTLINSS